MKITDKCRQDICSDALNKYPMESCGFVVRGRYIPLENIADDPKKEFAISADNYLKYEGRISAVVHSHPNGPSYPSCRDMEGQIATGLPWILVATNGVECDRFVVWGDGEIPDLVGREFIHGVTDCYSLIHDYYLLELEIELPQQPRDDAWWTEGKSLYLENFERAGFRRISMSEAKPGDVFLAQIRSPVPNHGGIICENSLILHHVENRLSRHDPLGPWSKFITHVLRHKDMEDG